MSLKDPNYFLTFFLFLQGFTTVGKPKMTTKQYNSPLEIYGDEALEEIMEQGTLL